MADKSAEKSFELSNPAPASNRRFRYESGTIGPDVIDIAHLTRDQGVFTFDPGFGATACLRKQDHLYRWR